MKKIEIHTTCSKMLADVFTPAGIYLRVRDRFRDTVLLESSDFHTSGNSYSFICIHAIGGIEIRSPEIVEYKFPGHNPEKAVLKTAGEAAPLLWEFLQGFNAQPPPQKEALLAQGLFGYQSYDAAPFFEAIRLRPRVEGQPPIPLLRFRLYQYVIVMNHYRDELYLCENRVAGMESEADLVESLIRSKDVPVYPFRPEGEERSNMSDEAYREMVRKGIAACHRGDVFQVVLSRRFQQSFTGDEFNVYRALRSINPSPYLFYFDYGDYRLMGSSPESQIRVQQAKAMLHPIAGTFPRSGDDVADGEMAARLLNDKKENAEHVMLVDLARNDLSRVCDEVKVTQFRQVQYFSHVIHLVSEVTGAVRENSNPFELAGKTFPAGTLSGAPKIRAMQLIDSWEPTGRNFYGGTIGFIGFGGTCNLAILIRSFLSRNNELTYQAGAGIVADSDPVKECGEVNNKLGALKNAIAMAGMIR